MKGKYKKITLMCLQEENGGSLKLERNKGGCRFIWGKGIDSLL